VVGLAGLATAGVAASVVLLSTLAPVPSPEPGPPPGGSSTVVASTPPASPPVPVRVPVYFSAEVDGRPVLFREYLTTTMPAAGGELMAALNLSVQGAAADPDYGTRWPAGARIRQVSRSGEVASVDVTGVPSGAGDDPLAVQQLVYTATAVLADLGDPATAVWVTIDAVEVPGVQPVTRASTVDTLAPLWLVSPQHGATVTGTFDVHLAGSVWEAAARLRVRDATGTVVSDDPVQLNAGAPQRGEAHVPLTLPPGRYTIEAYFVSAQDGSERGLDGHEITVS
jgi:hypothetical protein